MRDAAHQPPHIEVAHLRPPGIHSFWITHLNGPRQHRWKLPRPPTILALPADQSRTPGDPLAPLALALAPLAHHFAVALFVVFAVALYVS